MFKFIENMKKLQEKLAGYKTYIIAILGVGLAAIEHFGFKIPPWILGQDSGVLFWLGLGAVRAAIKKVEPIIDNVHEYLKEYFDEIE